MADLEGLVAGQGLVQRLPSKAAGEKEGGEGEFRTGLIPSGEPLYHEKGQRQGRAWGRGRARVNLGNGEEGRREGGGAQAE